LINQYWIVKLVGWICVQLALSRQRRFCDWEVGICGQWWNETIVKRKAVLKNDFSLN